METFVRWFDRWRHVITVAVAGVITPIAIHRLAERSGLDWLVLQIVIGILLGAVVMVVTGTVFAALIAIAESHLVARTTTAERTLPAARVLSRRWFARLRRKRRRGGDAPGDR